MWLPLLLYMLFTSSTNSQLSCDRISISFCCTTRIREQCPTQCANVNCDDGFIHSLFSIDSPKSQAKDGSTKTNVEGSTFTEIDTDFVVTKPDEFSPPQAPPPTPRIENFATLIQTSTTTTELPTTTRSFITRKEPRRRTTPDPRIIRPPESLVVIGDYDEDEPASENAVVFVDSPSPLQTTTEFPIPPPTTPSAFISNSGDTALRSRKEISDGTASRSKPFYRRRASAASNRLICRIFTPGRLACDRRVRSLQAVGPPGFSPVPTTTTSTTTLAPPRRRPIWRGVVRRPSLSRDQRRRNFSTSRIQITPFNEELLRRRRKLDRGSSAEWKVSIIPRQQKSQRPDINAIPALTIDGKSDERFNKFYRNFGKVFSKMTEPDSSDIHPEVSSGSIESSASIARPRTTVSPGTTNRVVPKISATTRGPPAVAPGVAPAVAPKTCGVAPDFVPCVSTEVASRELLACCQRKNLPAGCQSLCRYDVTQAEIRLAMDRGQCGIFSVAPFLECASQGKDNSECCRHRGILQKTGPQCEQFCRPAQGLTALGIQHLVCGGAVGDMLHCHHSGVRI